MKLIRPNRFPSYGGNYLLRLRFFGLPPLGFLYVLAQAGLDDFEADLVVFRLAVVRFLVVVFFGFEIGAPLAVVLA